MGLGKYHFERVLTVLFLVTKAQGFWLGNAHGVLLHSAIGYQRTHGLLKYAIAPKHRR